MALSKTDVDRVRAEYGEEVSARREPLNVSKSLLDETISAIDSWIDTNLMSYNSSLPSSSRTALTQAQKEELLFLIARARHQATHGRTA